MNALPKITFFAAQTKEAQAARKQLEKKYGGCSLEESDTVVVLGGDGTMLEALHKTYDTGKPVFGMNFGSVGFLMNPYAPDDLHERLSNASRVDIHPLRMCATDQEGDLKEALAFNEVSLLRQTRQTAKIKISVDDVERIPKLVCDGILLSTPAGSTAYNLSADGPILPLGANVMALTPISAFRPRRWRGALLPHHANVKFDILEPDKRPVSVTADSTEFRNIRTVSMHQSREIRCTLLFDPDQHLEERILKEQFLP